MRQTAESYEYQALMDMLDDIFFSGDAPENRRGFLSLLPKLYKEQRKPWENNYVVREGETLKAAVGLYASEISTAGHVLKCGGIGNVGVAKDCRRKGYMKLAMDASMQGMREAGCDFGALSGHRHRYQYWGFECCGVQVHAEFTRASVKHSYEAVDMSEFTVAEPTEESLPKLMALIEKAALHITHDRSSFYDTLCSWECKPRIVWRGKDIIAYFALQREGSGINDFHLFDPSALPVGLHAIFSVLPEAVNSFGVSIPLWEKDLLAGAEFSAEWLRLENSGQFTILNYERTLRALLALQCGLKKLPNGELSVRIHGMCCDELLRLCVSNQESTVEAYEGTPELTLSHLEAMRFFLGLTSPTRTSPLANAWFPLPLFMYDMDKV